MYEKVLALAFRLSQIAVWVGGSMMLFAAVMVSADVLSRRLLGLTMGGSDEVSGYLFAISTALAMPYALLLRANVRIDAVYMFLPQRLRSLLDIVSVLLLAVFAGIVTWRAALTLEVTWANGSHSITPLQTPLILPQSLWFAGWLLFCLSLALVLYGLVRAAFSGEFAMANRLGGALSLDEEIEEETAGLDLHGRIATEA